LISERVLLRKELAEWLESYKWDYFLTVTFREPRAPHLALNTLNSVQKVLRRFGPKLLFLGTEQHVSSLLHVHGLIADGLIALPSQLVWKALFERFGRSKVDKVLDNGKVSRYVSKYVAKDLGEWGVW